MIKTEDGKVIIEGRRDKVLAEVTTILRALKELVSEELDLLIKARSR